MLTIRKTISADIPSLMEIFDEARETIAKLGIDQWQNGYPSREIIENDVNDGISYAAELDGALLGTFVMLTDGEPTYDKIYEGKWLTGSSSDYVAIHRVAIRLSARGSGLSGKIIEYAEDFAKSVNRRSLRIDTHEGNLVMRRMLEKNGFTHTGTIYLTSNEKRVAYEKII